MQIYGDIGIGIPEILLPRQGVDLSKWAVIACDQFTSEPEYWRQVADQVADAPSTLRLVLPEIELGSASKEERIRSIHQNMHKYLHSGLLEQRHGMLYVERRVGGKVRRGLLLCLDLERYDYSKGSSSLIRATEGTIVERLPPRMAIREGAPLELPHILVLIDDPDRTVIEPIQSASAGTQPIYDFELMLGSGHLTGFGLEPVVADSVIGALRQLAEPATYRQKYALGGREPVLLFAMGDGNHSLATAKAVWEKMKARVGMQHPARFALVEVENVHDEGLEFSPIHRVLFGLKGDLLQALQLQFPEGLSWKSLASFDELVQAVDAAMGAEHSVGLVQGTGADRYRLMRVAKPTSNLPVGTLQAFLDAFIKQGGADRIDYVHGNDVVERLGSLAGNAGFYLPRMSKSSLFKTVILDGALPRKTFSMGEALEKRFYMEARKIT